MTIVPTERDEARFWSKVALPNEQGCMGAVRVDSTGRTYWLPAIEIVSRWPWEGGE